MERRRFKQKTPLQDRLVTFLEDMRRAAKAAPSPERDELLRRASQADTALDFDDWAHPLTLQSPE